MKIPKVIKAYCPYCRKSTNHKVAIVKGGGKRGALKHGSIERARKRGLGRGYGNLGKWGSKVTARHPKPKRSGAKSTKKVNLKLTCEQCNKSIIKIGKRAKKIEFKER